MKTLTIMILNFFRVTLFIEKLCISETFSLHLLSHKFPLVQLSSLYSLALTLAPWLRFCHCFWFLASDSVPSCAGFALLLLLLFTPLTSFTTCSRLLAGNSDVHTPFLHIMTHLRHACLQLRPLSVELCF